MTEVWVRRQYNDYRIAKYELNSIEGIHWDRVSGGVGAQTPQAFLHGYVSCDGMLEGELSHSGIHGPCPHQIKVCILKMDNDPKVYAQLKEQAGPKPYRSTCREDAIRIVRDRKEIYGPELRELLKAAGHSRLNISLVLPRMERKGELTSERKGHAKVYRLPDNP